MSCVNTCECECLAIDGFGQCDTYISFDLGILNAEKDVIFNITGRSKRIYQLEITTDGDGIASINTGNLTVGYLSIYSKNKYKVFFQDKTTKEPIQIRNTGKYCFEFPIFFGKFALDGLYDNVQPIDSPTFIEVDGGLIF